MTLQHFGHDPKQSLLKTMSSGVSLILIVGPDGLEYCKQLPAIQHFFDSVLLLESKDPLYRIKSGA